MEKRRHKSHRIRTIKTPQQEFWKRNSIELTAAVLALLGIYLLVEQTDVSENIINFLKNVITSIATVFGTIALFIRKWIEGTENSDIVGYTLIMTAIFLLGYRTRNNLIKNYQNTRSCPKCQSGLNRIHRKFTHKIIGFIFRLRVKNYRCISNSCAWHGIQISTHHI